MFELSQRDHDRLAGVHPHIVRVVLAAARISDVPFAVLEGLRTLERQRQLVAAGASQTMNSRHLTGHAVDLAPMIDHDGDGRLEITWAWPMYHRLAVFVKRAAAAESVSLQWGGDWVGFKDGPHWQLPFASYPGRGAP